MLIAITNLHPILHFLSFSFVALGPGPSGRGS